MRSTESKCEHLTLEGALDTTGEGSKEQDEQEGQVLVFGSFIQQFLWFFTSFHSVVECRLLLGL